MTRSTTFSKIRHTGLMAMTAMAFILPAGQALAAPETYKIDPGHTAVTWHASHFGYSSPAGKFMNIEGSIVIDQDAPQNSHVSVTIPVDKVNTGLEKFDEHLKSADFFDVAKYPTATFKSSKVELTGENTAKVMGDLTLHGVTKPVTLDVTLNKIGKNPFGKQTAGFTATTTIKRSEFGIVTYLPGIADDIKINIESESNL